nr:PREDICTED: uncharacterized protein LOC103278343 [Anolis carolinensis]|eukprot:XP_016848213.1 PREDICTED: uncharacterized protein LOC103278343 [Anolis carolinensis]
MLSHYPWIKKEKPTLSLPSKNQRSNYYLVMKCLMVCAGKPMWRIHKIEAEDVAGDRKVQINQENDKAVSHHQKSLNNTTVLNIV